ncbi:sodium:calcium antiporter [Chloroflexota bacterium]
MIWLKFSICVLIILVAGRKVARYGDIIGDKTGLGGLWIGLVLLSVVTSLPELVTGISSVALVKAPDLTIGDLFGSNVINLLILGGMDIAYQNKPLLTAASPRHLVPASLSMILVAFAAACVLISTRTSWDMGIGWIGIYTPILVLLYIYFLRVMFKYEQRHNNGLSEVIEEPESEAISLRRVYVYFIIAAVFVIGAGTWLAYIGRDISTTMEWGESFVGSLFVAFSTSMPEISVSYAALRLGAIDMCVADIIGSNMFNMLIISVDDVFYRQGPVLAAVSENHAITGLIVLVMTGVVILGIASRTKHKTRLGFSWYVPLLAGLFIASSYISFTRGS